MQISGLLIRPNANQTIDARTGRLESVQPPKQDLASQTNQTLRAVVDAKEADKLLLRTRSRPAVYQNPMDLDPRSQRAVSVYQSLERSAERDYVSSVLGVDEYV